MQSALARIVIASALLLGTTLAHGASVAATLLVHESDANNALARAFELNVLGRTGVILHEREIVYLSPVLTFRQGAAQVTLILAQRDPHTGNVSVMKRVTFPLRVPDLMLTSNQVEVAIQSIGALLDFLPTEPRLQLDRFFTNLRLPVHHGRLLDSLRFPVGDNGLAITVSAIRLRSEMRDKQLVISGEADLDVTASQWQVARCWMEKQNWYRYKILSANGVRYENDALQARLDNQANVLGQAYAGTTKSFSPGSADAGSLKTADLIDWVGTWDDGKGRSASTKFYFAGTFHNGNEYVQLYSRVINYLAIDEHCADGNWQFLTTNVNRIAN